MSAMLKQKLIDIANGFTKYGLWKGGGSNNLSELDDVTLTNLQSNDVLTYNGSEWINDDNLQNQINTLNSNFSDIGKSCCFQQSNTTNITNTFCPVDIQNYNDDTDLYKADGSGVLITKTGTYVVQASFHVLFAGGDDITLRLVNSISELLYTAYTDTNLGNSKQFVISLSKIVRIKSGQERVLLQLLSRSGNSYIFDKNSTNINRIAITKIG